MRRAEHEVVKPRAAGVFEAYDLAVEDGRAHDHFFAERFRESVEAAVGVIVATDEGEAVGLNVGEGSETVVLELVERAGVVEGFAAEGEGHGDVPHAVMLAQRLPETNRRKRLG